MKDSLVDATLIQSQYLTKGVSIMVKHYESGTFQFSVMTHNGDATGWTKVSPFITKSRYTYLDALLDGIKWYELYAEEHPNNRSGMGSVPETRDKKDTDFGSIIKYEY